MFIYVVTAYFLILLAIALFISTRTENEADFLVGGRRFNLWLTTFCLFATWFGAGTLIAATDEVAAEGLQVTALEPYGAGMCLILAGIFFAKPLWEMKLMTYADLFKKKYGHRVELLSVFLNIPIYVGWVAVQLIAISQIFAAFYPQPLWVFIVGFASFSCLLTVLGGMWSVSITDGFQLLVIVVGLFYLFFKITDFDFAYIESMMQKVSHSDKILIPSENWSQVFQWLGVFSISALGNMTGQDLGQRMFSARSARIAQVGCLLAGVGYIIIGSIPVFLGLTANQTLGATSGAIIPSLIKNYLDPVTGLILSLTIISAVISTITSALLAPSSLLSHNFLKNHIDMPLLKLSKLSVVIITLLSVLTALAGEDVYEILEASYAIGFVGFFVPVTVALYSKRLNETACLIAIFSGILIWSPEFLGYDNLPYALMAVALGYPIYFGSELLLRQKSTT